MELLEFIVEVVPHTSIEEPVEVVPCTAKEELVEEIKEPYKVKRWRVVLNWISFYDDYA